jgi:hypothetical protein
VQHGRSHAAKQDSRCTAVAMRSDGDEIGALAFGQLE